MFLFIRVQTRRRVFVVFLTMGKTTQATEPREKQNDATHISDLNVGNYKKNSRGILKMTNMFGCEPQTTANGANS